MSDGEGGEDRAGAGAGAGARRVEAGAGASARRVDDGAMWARAQEVASRFVDGDRAAAEELITELRPWILRLAGRQFPHRGDAEDVTQNVCITVIRRIGQLRNLDRLRSWVAAITLNEVRTFYRRAGREAERIRRAGEARPIDGSAPERTSVIGGLRVDLLDGLDRLPQHYAFALGLRQFGIGYDAIAEELSRPDRLAEFFDDRTEPIPVGTVKRWVNRARHDLAESLDPDHQV